MTDLKALLERVEKAEGADREIDRALGLLAHSDAYVWSPEWYSGPPNEYLRWPDPKPDVAKYEIIPRYTASLDASIALVEKMLPGVSMSIHRKRYPSFSGPDRGEVFLYVHPGAEGGDTVAWYGQDHDSKSMWPGTVYARTLPLALLSALLRALIAKEGETL